MVVEATWAPGSGPGQCQRLYFDGQYLVAGFDTYPTTVKTFAASDLSEVATSVLGALEDDCTCLAFDGAYIYAGLV